MCWNRLAEGLATWNWICERNLVEMAFYCVFGAHLQDKMCFGVSPQPPTDSHQVLHFPQSGGNTAQVRTSPRL